MGQASQVGKEPALQEGVKGLAPLYLLSPSASRGHRSPLVLR